MFAKGNYPAVFHIPNAAFEVHDGKTKCHFEQVENDDDDDFGTEEDLFIHFSTSNFFSNRCYHAEV